MHNRRSLSFAHVVFAPFVFAAVACSADATEPSPAPAPTATPAGPSNPAAPASPAHWTYEGEDGPDRWADLDPAYSACVAGTKQSPIDIPGSLVAPAELKGIATSYAAAPVAMVDNGHTVQINFTGGSNAITLAGKEYKLVQFHMHRRSEHTVDGAPHALEVHLVHKSADGALAVLGVFFDAGKENGPMAEVFDGMPGANANATALPDMFDPSTLLPSDRSGWAYDGSLTTPPCTEGVKWHVFSTPMEIAPSQLSAFKHDPSFRPTQAIGSRIVSGGN